MHACACVHVVCVCVCVCVCEEGVRGTRIAGMDTGASHPFFVLLLKICDPVRLLAATAAH